MWREGGGGGVGEIEEDVRENKVMVKGGEGKMEGWRRCSKALRYLPVG